MKALAGALRDSATLVAKVAGGASLAGRMERVGAEGEADNRAAVLDLTHGTLRRYGWVQAVVHQLSTRAKPESLVESLLWCALYALASGRYRSYTVVDQAVTACSLLRRPAAMPFVNAVLRGYLRRKAAVEARTRSIPEARYWHPGWWIEKLREAYPARWENVISANNSQPPMCLRVNLRRTNLEAYLRRLAAAAVEAKPCGRSALLLEHPVPVQRLPGFEQGEVSVQDAGAQRAAPCLDLEPGQRVLDACAAPGGKTAHILETTDVEMTALDLDDARLVRLSANLARLGLNATVRCADCSDPASWWDGVPFDRILADVPCSASGIVRRHPDLKWLRRAGDVAAFASRQAEILDSLWQVLVPGGKLLYVTCSVFPEENERVIEAFVERSGNARRLPLPDGREAQWLPDARHDGFYYALIAKQP